MFDTLGTRFTLFAVLLALSITISGVAQTEPMEDPFGAEAKSPSVTALPELSWLSGTWRAVDGHFNGKPVDGTKALLEEVWTTPEDGIMMGMFRWQKPDGILVYEIQTITAEDQGVFYRLRHFSSDLAAWEEKDEPFVYPLISAKEGRVVFENPERNLPRRFIYESAGPNELMIRLEGVAEDGRQSASQLHFTRVVAELRPVARSK